MTDRNNQDRFSGSPPQIENVPQQVQQTMHDSVQRQQQHMQFAVPTEFVDLPSKGKYYPEGHPLKDKDSVEIKYMTAKEEDILSSTNLIKKGVVFERLLQSVLVDRIDPNDFLIGDKNAILVSTRINGYGPEYQTEVKCPSCSNTSRYVFDLNNLTSKMNIDKQFMDSMNVEETERGTFKINLDRLNHTIEVKPLNGHDEKRIAHLAGIKTKNNFVEGVVTDTLKTFIVSVNGDTNPTTIGAFVDSLPARESRTIRTIYKHIVPKIEILSPYSCANCGYEQELEVPINSDFFWPNE